MLKILLVGFIAAAMLFVGIGTACADQAWIDFVEYFLTLSIEDQDQLRATMTPDELVYLEKILAEQESATVAIPPIHNTQGKKITAGVPTQLTYTVVAQNLSGVPVVDPVIRDNGRILNNDDAVKTGGNQDNVLEVGETWTWIYQETVTASMGQVIVNTATIEGPDDENLDTNPVNNQASTTIDVVEPPGSYDLAITKTVTATEVTEAEEIPVTERETRVLDECDVWSAANSGGYLGTRDPWDISALPPGTVFDIRFNAQSVPDKYVVQYPVGVTVLDTGWRGVQSYVDRNPHLYPGGLSGPGRGQEDGIFVKGQEDTFVVIVYGPEENTAWDYQIKANCPE